MLHILYNIMLKDIGMIVPKIRQTRTVAIYVGDDGIQQ